MEARAATVPKLARVHVAFETDGGDMTETMSFPYENVVDALAALAAPKPPVTAAAAPTLFGACGNGRWFKMTAHFYGGEKPKQAFAAWVKDVFGAADTDRQWYFAWLKDGTPHLCLFAWIENLSGETFTVNAAAIQAAMRATKLPDELRGAQFVFVEAIEKEAAVAYLDAITALEVADDQPLTRRYGHFRYPTRVWLYRNSKDVGVESTAFEFRVAHDAVPSADDIRDVVEQLIDGCPKGKGTWRFVWSKLESSARITRVFARLDAPHFYGNEHRDSILVSNVRETFEATKMTVGSFKLFACFKGLISIGVSPISPSELFPLWTRAIAHQSPAERAAAFECGWLQRSL